MQYQNNVFLKSLQHLKLKLYRSKPFGNCFFNSISKYLRLSENIHHSGMKIRQNLIQYIEETPFILEYLQQIGGMSMEQIAEDLQELKQSGVYDLDIFDFLPTIVATQYRIKVVIYTWMDFTSSILNDKDKEVYHPVNHIKSTGEIYLLYSNLEHYDLLFPNK